MTRAAYIARLAAWAEDWLAGRADAWDAARFAQMEAELLAWQCAHIPDLAAFSRARAPARPFVPVTLLKTRDLSADYVPRDTGVVFETSGTSDGRPGRIRLADTGAYDLSLLAGLRHFLLPDAPQPLRVISLVPTATERPHSSLGHMVRVIGRSFGDGGGGWYLDALTSDLAAPLRVAPLRAALQQAVADQVPVLVLATSLALELVLQHWPAELTLALPTGSRLMDTGGPKGRTLQADRATQHAWLARTWGLAPEALVGELGMTELATPRYEPVLRQRLAGQPLGPDARAYVGPPWLRSIALDLKTQQALPAGELGMLAHIDLANVDTPAWILTADLGRVLLAPQPADGRSDAGEAVVLAGRVPGAEWRGCGLDAEALVAELARS